MVVVIPLYSNKAEITRMKGTIYDVLDKYEGASLIIDPIGSGAGLCQELKAEGVFFTEVHWGNACFNKTLKKYYYNKRSHAYVQMARAIEKGQFSLSEKVKNSYQLSNQITEQLIKLPYHFDEKARWQMTKKEDMRKKGIPSPDIVDTFAFAFLENFHYAPRGEGEIFNAQQKDEQEWDDMMNVQI